LSPGAANEQLANEANEMRRERNEPARPHGGRVYELIRAGPDGSCWRAADGVEVRLAAAERERGLDFARGHLRAGITPVVRVLFGVVFAR
jgi:hypothetical protein